jgi:hypothetical protein
MIHFKRVPNLSGRVIHPMDLQVREKRDVDWAFYRPSTLPDVAVAISNSAILSSPQFDSNRPFTF